ARQYAESVGKRLPTEVEYEFAATDEGRRDFPWGQDGKPVGEDLWQPGPVRVPAWDRTPAGIFGLYSNALEWTDSLQTSYDPANHPSVLRKLYNGEVDFQRYRTRRVVRGGPMTMLAGR